MRIIRRHYNIWNIWRRSFQQNKRAWLSNVFLLFFEPLVILWAIGYGLGTFITTIDGVTYPDFFFPALLCTSAMMVTFYESTYEFYSKLHHQKIYSNMLMTSISSSDIVIGEALWAASKGTLCAALLAIGASLIGHMGNILIVPSLIVIFISCFLFAVIGFVFVTMIRNSLQLIYLLSGLALPMSLLCGTYFPLRELPWIGPYLIYILPLSHVVALVRGFLLGGLIWWKILLHLFYLSLLSVAIYHWACKRLEKKITDR